MHASCVKTIIHGATTASATHQIGAVIHDWPAAILFADAPAWGRIGGIPCGDQIPVLVAHVMSHALHDQDSSKYPCDQPAIACQCQIDAVIGPGRYCRSSLLPSTKAKASAPIRTARQSQGRNQQEYVRFHGGPRLHSLRSKGKGFGFQDPRSLNCCPCPFGRLRRQRPLSQLNSLRESNDDYRNDALIASNTADPGQRSRVESWFNGVSTVLRWACRSTASDLR